MFCPGVNFADVQFQSWRRVLDVHRCRLSAFSDTVPVDRRHRFDIGMEPVYACHRDVPPYASIPHRFGDTFCDNLADAHVCLLAGKL